MADPSFRDYYQNAFASTRTQKVSRPIQAMDESLAKTAALGHPEYEFLQTGQTTEGKALVFFLDIRGFTKLCFVYDNELLVQIVQALTSASVSSIARFGGYVVEFTGDGVMAVFGNSGTQSEETCLAGLHCAAFLMKGVRDDVNPNLKDVGSDPIRVAVGMEFGDVLWTRIGALNKTQVKPISEVTFLAGKLSTKRYTDAWEAKVGENLAAWIPDEFKLRAKRYEYQLGERSYSHDLFLFKWKEFGEEYQKNSVLLRKRLLERKLSGGILPGGRAVAPDPAVRSSPRTLKDQPFF